MTARQSTVHMVRSKCEVAGSERATSNISVVAEPLSRWWGGERALLDDDEARGRILEAAGRCVASRGDTQIRMAEVADEAGIARSTVYRYFASRDEMLLALVLMRTDTAMVAIVRALRKPKDAARSIPRLILDPLDLVERNPLNEALFADESTALLSALQVSPEPVVDVLFHHFGPLLEQWQADGQLYEDLNLRDTVRWMISVSLFLLAPEWRSQTKAAKRRFVEQYLVRALLRS